MTLIMRSIPTTSLPTTNIMTHVQTLMEYANMIAYH